MVYIFETPVNRFYRLLYLSLSVFAVSPSSLHISLPLISLSW